MKERLISESVSSLSWIASRGGLNHVKKEIVHHDGMNSPRGRLSPITLMNISPIVQQEVGYL
jgi:hypothetical protein